MIKENSVEVEFVDQPSCIKVAKEVPKPVFLEQLESKRPDELKFELDEWREQRVTQIKERPPSFPVCSNSIQKTIAGPSEIFKATSFNNSNMNHQVEHVLKVKRESMLMIASCHYKCFEEIKPFVRELSAVNFSEQSFSVLRGFGPKLIQLVALIFAAFNFHYSQSMATWLFCGWDPPWTGGSKLKFAGKGVA